jgi:hypothetical protein
MPGVADDTIDAAEKTGPRGHTYDNNGNRVTCLPCEDKPFVHECAICGFVAVATSETTICEARNAHDKYMRTMIDNHG